MKEHLISGIKKLAVILIASLMILGLVPIGLISKPDTVRAEGEFWRLLPIAETSVHAAKSKKSMMNPYDAEATQRIGGDYHAYLRFHTENLLHESAEQLRSVKLRLTFLRTPATQTVPIRIALMSENDWNANMTYANRPVQATEMLLVETAVPSAESPFVFEVDLTEYAKVWRAEGRDRISLHLSAPGEEIAAVYADRDYQDPAFRPCLKIVTGDAVDTDSPDLTKAWLSASATSGKSKAARGTYLLRDDNSTYLVFTLNRDHILGAMYRIYLQMNIQSADEGSELKIYQLKDQEISQERLDRGDFPQGEEQLIYHAPASAASPCRIDLTDVVNDGYAKGESTVALRLCGGATGSTVLTADGKNAPHLAISVSDRRDVTAVEEAAVKALSDNTDLAHITENLLRDYTAENGERVFLQWSATDVEDGATKSSALRTDGSITRPRWFEKPQQILATATISSGNYTRKRSFYLTVLPKEAPDLSGHKLDSMVDIGMPDSEKKQAVESVATVSHHRWIGAQNIPYRTLRENSTLVMHFAVNPTVQNAFTLKLWAKDAFGGVLVSDPQNPQREPIRMMRPDMVEEEDGFLYLTYPLPMEYTEGKESLSLCITPITSEETKAEEWNLYGAYITQTPYFDPMQFAEQGEVMIRKNTTEDSAFYQFLKRLYDAASLPFLTTEEDLGEAAVVPNGTEDATQRTVLVQNGEEKISVSIGAKEEKVRIHRETPYYHAYTETEQTAYYDGKLIAVDYGLCRIFLNLSHESLPLPWKAEGMSGLYRDLSDGSYISYTGENEILDDSVLPIGTIVEDGSEKQIASGENAVFLRVAEPLQRADWRVASLDGRAVASVRFGRTQQISRIGIRNLGAPHDTSQPMLVYAAVYAQGVLCDAAVAETEIAAGETAHEVVLPHTLVIEPGQNLKVYAEPVPITVQEYTPKLELP